MVYQLEYYRRFRDWGIKDRVSFEDYLKLERKEDFARNVEFFIMGRAAYKLKETLKEFYPRYKSDHFFDEPCITPFLRNWHNHFDNYGNYIPGFCGGISLGDCRELDKLLKDGIDLEQYSILGFLISGDFKGFYQFAKDYGYIESRDGYLSKCHLCTDIRKYLILKEDFKELRPKEFYLHLE